MGFLSKIFGTMAKFPVIKQVTGGIEKITGIDPETQLMLGGLGLGLGYGVPALTGGGAAGAGAAGAAGMTGGTGGMMGTAGLGGSGSGWLGSLGSTVGGLAKGAAKKVGGAITSDWGKLGGLQLLSGAQKSQQMKGMAEAQQKSYQDYLNLLQPSEATKTTQFSGLKSGLTGMHSQAQRQLENTLAARGIRGQGAASPVAGGHQALQDAVNQAYFQVYGQPARVPSAPASSGYYPGGGELGGMDITNILSTIMMKKMFG